MLQPRQLTAFILLSTACALVLALVNATHHRPATTALPQQAGESIVAEPAPPVMVTEYHAENQSIPDFSNTIPWIENWNKLPSPEHEEQQTVSEETAYESAEETDWQIASEHEIPFPLYPNGTRYRIGGEAGMKIALFETTDDFSTVDAFYDQQSISSGLARKSMTEDYVKYIKPGQSETAQQLNDAVQPELQPGVVIHEFFDAREATKLGAAPDSRTNIIISFR